MIYFILIGLILVVIGILVLLFTSEKDSGISRERVDDVQRKYSTRMNRVKAGQEAGAAAARANLLTEVNRETEQLTETINQQTANDAAKIKQEHNALNLQNVQEKTVADHALNMRLTNLAVDHKLDVPNFLEVQKQILLNEQDRLHQSNLAADQIRMGVIAELLSDHQRMAEIQRLIDGYLMEIAELSKGKLRGQVIDDLAIPEMISSRRESLAAWEADKRGIQKRLLQTGNGEDPAGEVQDSDVSGNG